MTTIEVHNQAELDAAISAHGNNPAMVIRVVAGDVTLRTATSATVRAYGSATVRASGSATVRASGSATVRAYDSATVRASGSATVRASGSATVRAYDSATVRAYDSATVRAYDSATVRAYDSATVEAYDSATVEASTHAAIHKHSTRTRITGGVTIDHTTLDLNDPRVWAGYVGATVTGDTVTLYKAVDKDYYAGHQYHLTRYPIGGTVTAPDWRDDHNCGHGLHASPHPHQALDYYPDAARMLTVECDLGDLRPIRGGTPKAKAATFRVTGEVRLDGNPL